MSLTLGATPDRLTVNLVPGSDFFCGLRSKAGAWPAGATLALIFNDAGTTTWSATLGTSLTTGDLLSWNVDKAAVATLYAALQAVHSATVKLVYTDTTSADLVYARGTVLLR